MGFLGNDSIPARWLCLAAVYHAVFIPDVALLSRFATTTLSNTVASDFLIISTTLAAFKSTLLQLLRILALPATSSEYFPHRNRLLISLLAVVSRLNAAFLILLLVTQHNDSF